MIGSADVYLFDEPTSGLSSKDSEHVIEIIRGMAHNKIVLVTIHQPTSKLFQMFHKAMLLDKGGKLVFFGTPQEMLRYFAEAEAPAPVRRRVGGLRGLRHDPAGIHFRRCSKRRCAICPATLFSRKTIAASWFRRAVIHRTTGGTNMKRFA